MERLYFTTSDNVKIVANEFLPDKKKYPTPRGWVIFLHMMPATKESWNPLADQLQQAGYAGLAIDLRGHGASEGGPNGYKEFSDAEHQDSIRDVDAAIDILHGIGVRDDRIVLIGASIGANLALQYASQHRAISCVVAISPGADYHGIVTKPFIEVFSENKRVLFIGSLDDDHVPGNEDEIEVLHAAVPDGVLAEKEIVDSGGHGTEILANNPELINKILTFIQQ